MGKSASSNQNAGVLHKIGEHSLAATAVPFGMAGESLNAALGPPACSSSGASAAFEDGDGLKQGMNAGQCFFKL